MTMTTTATNDKHAHRYDLDLYTDRTLEVEHEGLTFRVTLHVDDSPDLSYIGEYLSKPDDDTWIIDRKDGTLRGAYLPEPEEPDIPDAPDPDDYDTDDEYYAAYDEYCELEADLWDEYNDRYDAWLEAGAEVLDDGLSTMGWHELRWFKPYAGGLEPWNDPDCAAEWARYAQQDYTRMEELNSGWWCVVGVVVETDAPTCPHCAHTDTLHDSLWGIESDADDYLSETAWGMIESLAREYWTRKAEADEVVLAWIEDDSRLSNMLGGIDIDDEEDGNGTA